MQTIITFTVIFAAAVYLVIKLRNATKKGCKNSCDQCEKCGKCQRYDKRQIL